MKVVIYFILIFGFIIPSYAQEVLVKEVWGNVEFLVGEKRTVVKHFSSFSEKYGVFILKDRNSQLLIKIGDKLDLLTFSEDKYKYPLKELITLKPDLEKKETAFLDKYFSIFSASHDDETKINDMVVSKRSGVLRSFNDTNIIFIEKLMMIDGYPLKIDFGSFINSNNKQNRKFKVLIKDMYNNQEIFNSAISETYFSIETENIKKSLFLQWELEINEISSSRKIKGKIQSKPFKKEEKKLLDQLKDKAIVESKTNKCTYQIIFIESLRLSGLLSNASYYLDLFIETSNNNKLVKYRELIKY